MKDDKLAVVKAWFRKAEDAHEAVELSKMVKFVVLKYLEGKISPNK